MSSVIYNESRFQLTKDNLPSIIDKITVALKGRVREAYVFGSASTGDFRPESDIDLILVCDEVDEIFPHRGLKFIDIFSIYPTLDVLVYTPAELATKLADTDLGFWHSARQSMRKLI